MPKLINASFGRESFPRELLGLQSWTTITPAMIGASGPLWDACYVRAANSGSGGFYVIGGGGGSMRVVLSSGGGISKVDSPTISTIAEITGICSPASGGPGSSDKFVAIGGASGSSLTANGLSNVFNIASSWALNGSWTTNPLNNWPHRCETSLPGQRVVALGVDAGTGHKLISNKSWSDNTTSAWNVRTPGNTLFFGDGYIKGRVAPDGSVMACSPSGSLDISIQAGDYGDGGMHLEFSRPSVVDLDYGVNASLWVVCNGANVYTTTGWSPGGFPTWTIRNLPAGTAAPNYVVAMDIPNPPLKVAGFSSGAATPVTWFGIACSGSNFVGMLLTKDWVNYFVVEVPGLAQITRQIFPFDGSVYLRFCGNRLFIFNPYACHISGPLGVIDRIT